MTILLRDASRNFSNVNLKTTLLNGDTDMEKIKWNNCFVHDALIKKYLSDALSIHQC